MPADRSDTACIVAGVRKWFPNMISVATVEHHDQSVVPFQKQLG
jgi:hypothetical protein